MSYSGKGFLIRDVSEIHARRGYDPAAAICPETFDVLIAPYEFNERVRCQVKRSGGRCRQPHFKGYLGRMKDGREVLIGNRCGKKHFNASDDFIRQSRAIDAKLKLERLRGQLELILENKPRIAASIENARERTKVVGERASKIKRLLPPAVTRAVNVRRAQGNPIVTLDVSYEEKDEKGRKKTMWRSQRLGSLKGLAFWGMSIREMRLRLQEISESLEVACPAGTDDLSTLSQWVEDLSSVDRLLRDLDQYERALERFTDPENLRLVMFLVKSHLDQEAVA